MNSYRNFLAEAGDAEAIFRLMFERSPLGIALVDAASLGVLAVNPRLCGILGRAGDELLGDHWERLSDADDVNWYRLQRARLSAGEIFHFRHEARYLRPDGVPVWVSISVTPIAQGDAPAASYLMAMVEDISERKAAETELRLANERVALAERAARAGIWDWDLRSGKLTWSRAMFQLCGLDAAAVEPTYEGWLNTVHPEDRKAAESGWVEALDAGTALFNQYRIVLPDGAIRWVESYGDAERDAAGAVTRLIGFSVDVTESKVLAREKLQLERMARRLEESEERLQLALDASGLGLWDADIASGRAIYNKRWCEILGYQPDEIEAHRDSWQQRVHPDDLPAVQASLDAHLSGATAIHEIEHRLRHKDGHWVWVLGRGKVVERNGDGHPARLVGTILDISSRKRLAQEGVSLVQRFEALLREVAGPSAPAGPAAGEEKLDAVPAMLTRRQRQILALIAQGLTSAQIAGKLHIATATAVTHRRELMKKLDLHNAAEVTQFALRHQLLPG